MGQDRDQRPLLLLQNLKSNEGIRTGVTSEFWGTQSCPQMYPTYPPFLQRLNATCPQTCRQAAHEHLASDLAAHHWEKHKRISCIQLKDEKKCEHSTFAFHSAEPKGRNDSICHCFFTRQLQCQVPSSHLAITAIRALRFQQCGSDLCLAWRPAVEMHRETHARCDSVIFCASDFYHFLS